MNESHHRKVALGGELGAELERIWAAIRQNQVQPTAGVRVNRTPNGTTLNFGAATAAPLVSESTVSFDGTGTFTQDVHWPGRDERSQTEAYPFKQLTVQMNVAGNEEMVLLPPLGSGLISPHVWSYEGVNFPKYLWHMDFPSTATCSYYFPGTFTIFEAYYADSALTLKKSQRYLLRKFDSPLPMTLTDGAPSEKLPCCGGLSISGVKIRYYLEREQFETEANNYSLWNSLGITCS